MVGVYRFWRDGCDTLGALIAGSVADALGYGGAITLVAALTAASGLWVLWDMPAGRSEQHLATEPPDAAPRDCQRADAPGQPGPIIPTRWQDCDSDQLCQGLTR